MKFEEKYELLESLTSGKVETFVANDKLRGERVVVHVLHCDPQKPNQPTVQWVLDSFRRVAPEPAGLVLETGRYDGTLYAYLVTKMPDKAVLRGWVQQYNVQAKDTQELLIPQAKPEAQTDTATAEIPQEIKPAALVRDIPPEIKPVEPARVPIQFTQVFREFESHAVPSAPSAPAKEPELPPPPVPDLSVPNLPVPNLPFPNLGAAENPSGLRAAPAWDAGAPTPLVPPKQEPKFTSSVAPARADVPVQSFPAAPPKPAVGDRSKTGEFTSFFRGPFHVEGPSESPTEAIPRSPLSSREMEAPRKSVGAFTEMFGPITPAEQSQPSSKVAGSEPAGSGSGSGSSSGFTGLFADSEILSRKPTPAAPPPPAGLPRALSDTPATPSAAPREPRVAPHPAAPAAAVFTSLPPPIPVPPKPPSVIPAAPAGDGATGVFSTPTPSAPSPSEPVMASGPSPYTQVISVRPPNAAGGAAGSQKQPPARAPGASIFPPPTMPPLPSMAPPPMPQAPAIPKFAAPASPAIKPPKVETAKAPVSYWPLVLILTVLLFMAVLLVLYFVLKH
ncbi:MAG TPA: hypothetical protein VMQ17_13005 [Candidatus Sulfotelmatobacter sp.]|nr:hypothetical protein [Candidatus Sulfotelmatobacter sp.]